MWYLRHGVVHAAQYVILAVMFILISLLIMNSSSALNAAVPEIQLTATPTTTAQGLIAFLSGDNEDYDIYIMNADGSDLRNLTNHSVDDSQSLSDNQFAFEYDLVWSPDGSQMAFVLNRDWNQDIYVMNADGSELRDLTNERNRWKDSSPAWSPDGRQIAFVSQRNAAYEIYVMDADGSNESRRTVNNGMESMLTWSPDGRQILFYLSENGLEEIYTLQVNGGNIHRLTYNNAKEEGPTWSPDGHQIAFASDLDGDWDIYVMDADGGNTEQLTKNDIDDFSPLWSPDGTQIMFSEDRGDGYVNVHVIDADGSHARNLNQEGTYSNFGSSGNFTWSPDSHQIAFSAISNGNVDVYVADADGSNLRRLTNSSLADYFPAWQPHSPQKHRTQ